MSLRSVLLVSALVGLLVGCATSSPEGVSRKATVSEPIDMARLAYHRGLELLAADDYRAALESFQLVVAEDPFRYDAHYQMGVCYYELGEYELELLEYKKCLAINEHYPRVWRELGHASFLADDLETARVAYSNYLGTERDPLCVYNLALVESDLGHGPAAIDLFKEYLAQEQIDPNLEGRAERRLDELSRVAERAPELGFPQGE